jgi:hypothetical protein
MGHDIGAANSEAVAPYDLIGAKDLADASDEQLLAAIKHAGHSRNAMQVIAGRLVAEARRRKMSIRDIADRTGVPPATAHRWSEPYWVEERQP